MNEPFLSFTMETESRMLQLHANREGIDMLIASLRELKETGHLHLWGPEEGGFLSDKDPWGRDAITDVSMTSDKSHLRKPTE